MNEAEKYATIVDILHSENNFYNTSKKCLNLIDKEIDLYSFEIIEPQNIIQLFQKDIDKDKDYIETIEIFQTYDNTNIKIKAIHKKSQTCKISMFIKLIFNYYEKQKQISIAQNALLYDSLTGLPNMNNFSNRLEKLVIHNKSSLYSVLYMNIKKFSLLNKKFTFNIGNNILKLVGEKINSVLEEDELFARLGGDNFIALIKKENLGFFTKYIASLPICLNTQKKSNVEFTISFYAGVYEITGNEDSFNTIIDYSNIAYTVSRNSINEDIVFFNQELHNQIILEKELESLMPYALKNKNFIVFYQPKVNLKTFKLEGAEALIRWDKDDTLLLPMDFIHLAERNGFICEIDFYVYETICKTIREWLDEGIKPVTISINFSKLHLNNHNFVNEIIDITIKYAVPPKYLEIEFTETSYIDDFKNLFQVVNELRKFGIMISMDDFGTGFSSLNLLKDIPVDVLKLDKEFLNRADNNILKDLHFDYLKIDKSLLDNNGSIEREKIIIKNVISMAKELNIIVVSEGVETEEQAIFLKEIGCDLAQGYLFDRPMPIEKFKEKMLTKSYGDIFK